MYYIKLSHHHSQCALQGITSNLKVKGQHYFLCPKHGRNAKNNQLQKQSINIHQLFYIKLYRIYLLAGNNNLKALCPVEPDDRDLAHSNNCKIMSIKAITLVT